VRDREREINLNLSSLQHISVFLAVALTVHTANAAYAVILAAITTNFIVLDDLDSSVVNATITAITTYDSCQPQQILFYCHRLQCLDIFHSPPTPLPINILLTSWHKVLWHECHKKFPRHFLEAMLCKSLQRKQISLLLSEDVLYE
jgi:hypothetical protein